MRHRAIANMLVAMVSLPAISAFAADRAPAAGNGTIGRFEITTLPLDPGVIVRSATYTPSGKVLLSYTDKKGASPDKLNLATVDDNGKNMRPFFSQTLPKVQKNNGVRFMMFADNKHILLGDFIIECAQPFEKCTKPRLYPVEFPAEVADSEKLLFRWSEVIVAPDNRHIAWTTLFTNFSGFAFVGELKKEATGYKIVKTVIVSTLHPFAKDPVHPDGVIPEPVRGGEVKQFVHGGTAISFAGPVNRDQPGSVVQDLRTGAMDIITNTPGYNETTIFSPDERLGMTMSPRFSTHSDLAIVGLMPRPHPNGLNMGLAMLAYSYSVTGVRDSRPGSIGPVLIDIEASRSRPGYLGTNLNLQNEWVYRSPMSWHPSGTKALWPESLRGSDTKRVQIVHLLDYRPAPPARGKLTPEVGPYGISDLSVIKAYVNAGTDTNVKVYGKQSGYIIYSRNAGVIEKTYSNYSDDGQTVYSGSEKTEANLMGRSTYTAKINMTGPKPGVMDLKLTFGPIMGSPSCELIFAPDASGAPSTRGYVEYDGQRLGVETLAR